VVIQLSSSNLPHYSEKVLEIFN